MTFGIVLRALVFLAAAFLEAASDFAAAFLAAAFLAATLGTALALDDDVAAVAVLSKCLMTSWTPFTGDLSCSVAPLVSH